MSGTALATLPVGQLGKFTSYLLQGLIVRGLDWKLVRVYPVSSDGYAQLNLKELEGKGQTGDTALYVAPGHWLKKLLGVAWPRTIVIDREEVLWSPTRAACIGQQA